MINYRPKIGSFHILLCVIIGIVLAVFYVWTIAGSIKMLVKKEGKKGYLIIIILLGLVLLVMGTDSTLPYCKDLGTGSRSVTAGSYLTVRDNLYFLDDTGDEVVLKIPADIADDLRERESYEYDAENNLLKHYDPVTVVYYPNSKVIVSISE